MEKVIKFNPEYLSIAKDFKGVSKTNVALFVSFLVNEGAEHKWVEVSWKEVERVTGLSRSTQSKIKRYLRKKGVLKCSPGRGSGQRGRPPLRYKVVLWKRK